jgi:hypothetical protein
MMDNIDNLVEEKLFFRPSPELARAIVEQNQMLVSQSFQSNLDDEELDLEEDEGLEDPGTEVDSPLMLQETSAPPERYSGAYEYERVIGERLYHFLASMSESPYAREGGRFPLWEVIPGGMSTMLGVPRESNLIYSLTEEFRNWLRNEHQGTYKGPWWQILLDDDDTLVLKEIASKQDYLRSRMKMRGALAAAARDTSRTG